MSRVTAFTDRVEALGWEVVHTGTYWRAKKTLGQTTVEVTDADPWGAIAKIEAFDLPPVRTVEMRRGIGTQIG